MVKMQRIITFSDQFVQHTSRPILGIKHSFKNSTSFSDHFSSLIHLLASKTALALSRISLSSTDLLSFFCVILFTKIGILPSIHCKSLAISSV